MSVLVDPRICPDCRAPLDAATCTSCGLRLVGPAAAELWAHMQAADRLVGELRAGSTAPTELPQYPSALPAAPHRTAPSQRRLPNASVPVVLLALGGLCLLVAAVVFVAVAWSSLGLAAKATILAAVTALFAGGAVAVTRRDLRLAAETLWIVVAGLVGLDLVAAYAADLVGLGRLGDRDAVALVGATLLGLSVGVSAWATTTAVRRLHGLVAVAALGTLLLAGSEAWTSEHNPLAVTISVPVLALLALAIDRVSDGHLRPIALVEGGTAVVSWLVLLGLGVDRMSTVASDARWWSDLSGWPLLAAAGLAGATAVPRRLPAPLRMVAAGAALVAFALCGVGPSTSPTADLLAWAGVTVLVAAVSALAPRTWSRPAGVLTAGGVVAWSVLVLARPYAVIGRLPTTAPADHTRLGLHLPGLTDGPASWTAVVATLVVGATAAGLLRHVPSAARREAAGRAWIALGPGVLALGAATALLETGPTLLVAVVAWAAVLAIAAVGAATVRHFDAALAGSLLLLMYLVVTGLRLAVPSHLLAAALATMVALGLTVAYARARQELLAGGLVPGLAVAAIVTAGFAATHWPYVANGRADAAALALVAVSAAALVGARRCARDAVSRVAIEATALAIGLVAAAFPEEATVVATVLTVLGSAVAIASVLNRDRDEASWIALALLAVATLIRVVEDVRAPEAYTLPAAALLLAAGWWRLSKDDRVPSARALSSGLTLALMPSLLLALDEPVSLRGVLVGAGGVVVLAVGVARLWTAPLVAGSAIVAVLALRHLAPVVEGLPRWISLGSLGLALLLVGVTWERRRQDVVVASRYLTSLR